ncbi:glycosyltransferase family 4 protein [Phytohabitans sp. ZYX-F-186]|uniref:Glycosyltransferase family 4 protein n=1 Tax=Phytohabitans maris TaxID=3071409 RepID=A0ABU0ZRH1_9ACTN|nr:glycosyltransferase family 4 protein [Phytohabitans sp. ZYX-F-186]MDQ7909630.1 glycosyltransferase family 4 protein [Phytohabitans sp. ZYX-F-186]
MRILVYPHGMHVGGSQLNAIELAAAVRDLGHEVAVIGEPGPLVDRVTAMGMEHLPISDRRRRPSPGVTAKLRRLIRARGLDVVHGYEWPPALEANAAVYPGGRAAAVATVMSMAVAPFLPASMHLVVGTAALQRHTAARRPGPVHLIEPPVDVVQNAPGHPTADFRAEFGLDPGYVDIVAVTRLSPQLKLEGILTAIDTVGELAQHVAVRLVVVGDGVARETVEARAAAANTRAGRRAVVLTGELLDPRPAYAAADIMLGMGGSALRALAFGKPLVVQGEEGFWRLLTPESVDLFLEQGWYGVGQVDDLGTVLRRLLADPGERAKLGTYGRELVVERFSLQRAARLQVEIYEQALAVKQGAGARTRDGLRSLAGLAAHKTRRRYESLRKSAARDDFNAPTLAAASIKPGS